MLTFLSFTSNMLFTPAEESSRLCVCGMLSASAQVYLRVALVSARRKPLNAEHHLSIESYEGEAVDITLVCVPYQGDVTRWGYALGPQAFLDHGLGGLLEERGHQVQPPHWIELPREERTRDSVTNLGRIARYTAAFVSAAVQRGDFVLALI